MFAGSLILALTLMGFSVWLFHSEKVGWPNEELSDPVDQDYRRRRTRARRRVNGLFFVCGLMILGATWATPERQVWWISCWMSAMLVLLTILVLASFDVLRTVLHHRNRMDRIRRRDVRSEA